MLQVGLNPYGLTYTLGLQGRSRPDGLEAFVKIGEQLGARTLEMHNAWLTEMDDEAVAALREHLGALGIIPVISLGPPLEDVDSALRNAERVGAKIVRLGLSPVLCGDRAACGPLWAEHVAHARTTLKRFAPEAADRGLTFAVEDHQDFGSQELLDFCTEGAPATGICLDTGNPLAVGEEPIGFTKRVAPLVVHVHLKDYRAQWTAEGYRLVRCAIGDGAIPFPAIARILDRYNRPLTASLEPGALHARHIRLFRPDWWVGYTPRTAVELGPALAIARVNALPDDADWRTPFERGDAPEAIIEYEMNMIRRSAQNMRALGLMTSEARAWNAN